MLAISPEQMGIEGPEDPHYYQAPLNRVTISQQETDYRLVLFFIKKGTTMPLHDHPNMSVFFRLVYGKLNYVGYDKLDDKFKYNDFADDEYAELLGTHKVIAARKTRPMTIKKDALLYVRPSTNNMHTFTAEENSCFFDICLPNYTPVAHTRRITYYQEVGKTQANCAHGGLTHISYDTTPPVLPSGMEVREVSYKGYFI